MLLNTLTAGCAGEGPIFSNVSIPDKSFVAYFGSPSYSILLPQLTHTHGGCAQLTVLSSGNHYGITDFYNTSAHQVNGGSLHIGPVK